MFAIIMIVIKIISKNFNLINFKESLGGYYYGKGHPMKPHRVTLTNELIINYGLYRKMEIYTPKLATVEDMTEFHTPRYIQFLKNITEKNKKSFRKQMKIYNIDHDCPIFENLFQYCQLYTGGSLAAAVKLNKKEADIVINWSGGLHHAKKTKASGFCYVNDIVIAILELLKYHERVLYVDIDVHHGDGVEEAFYTTDRVMTVSFHNYGNFFPGTGNFQEVGISSGKFYSVNVPLKRGIDDYSYESIFKSIMTRVLEHYRPKVIVLQCGADSLSGDRLGTFNLTLKAHGKCVEFLKQQSLPLMLLGGGGYTMRNVARCWTYETSLALGVTIPNEIPYNDYYEYFIPDNKLHITPSNVPNENTIGYLQDIKSYICDYLKYVQHAPSVQMNEIPENEISMAVDNEIDNTDPDKRISIMDSDIYKEKDAELSDSEDEGDERKNIHNFNT